MIKHKGCYDCTCVDECDHESCYDPNESCYIRGCETYESLQMIGLSDGTAWDVLEYVTDTRLNGWECIQWLKENAWMLLELSEKSLGEIRDLQLTPIKWEGPAV